MTRFLSAVGRRARPVDLPAAYHQLWLGKSASSLSDFAVASALPILVAITTASPALVAAITTAVSLPWLLFGLTAGAFVDRFDRRHALIGVGLLRTGVFSAIALLAAAGYLPNLALLTAALVIGISEVVIETATVSITPQLVGSRQLERANARLLTAELIAETLAALAAGTLASLGAEAVFLTGALCGLAGLFALRRLLRMPLDRPVRRAESISRRGLLDGMRYLWATPVLRSIALIGAVINTAWAAFLATFVLFAIRPGPVDLSPRVYSLLLTASIAGGVFGSLIAPRFLARFGHRPGLALNVVANAFTFAVPALVLSPWLIAAGFLIGDTATPLWRVANNTLQQRSVPEELRGRVLAAYRVVSLGAAVSGPAIGAALAATIGYRALFGLLALVCLALLIPFQRTITTRALAELDRLGD